tara:strand:+ start:304 stop:534 length:231 start_codon:yes stop_codon:yes gene_type:complete
MENRVKKVMSDIFNIDIGSINNDSSPDNIETWDSLKHMNLIIALEEEFNIELHDDDIVEMLNYNLIIRIIKKCEKD